MAPSKVRRGQAPQAEGRTDLRFSRLRVKTATFANPRQILCMYNHVSTIVKGISRQTHGEAEPVVPLFQPQHAMIRAACVKLVCHLSSLFPAIAPSLNEYVRG